MSRFARALMVCAAGFTLTASTFIANGAAANAASASTAVVDSTAPAAASSTSPAERRPNEGFAGEGLEHLVPELAGNPYKLDPGARVFRNRFAFSPGYGSLGAERLFTFRFAYNPNQWLGYEGAFGHNPGQSVHAVLHTLSALLRYPWPGRFQPYASVGYGMVMVFPGQSINADPVTKNALAIGGGLEFYIRSDVALRAEMRHATVFGKEQNQEGVVTYDYLQQTIGITFYRSIRP